MMKKLRWPLLVVIVALAAIAVLLMSETPTLAPIPAPVVEPASGGIYTEGIIGQMIRLNPLLDYYNPADRDVDRLLFSGLIRFDHRGLPQADLADSWGISRDGTTYNFSIRQNAIWHDGQPVVSEDVLFTIELMRSADAPLPEDLKNLWRQVELNLLDEKTLQFRLPEPFAPFLDYLTFGVLPAHRFGGLSLPEIIDSQLNLAPIGSGPYRFEQLIVEDGQILGVLLSAFKEYYLQPPFIEQFAFRYYPDGAAALAAYQEGEILGINQVPLEFLQQVLQEPDLNLHTGRLPQLTLVFMNLDNPQTPFFQDAEIRRALLLGLNRQRMIDRLFAGQAILADGPIFPGTWAFYDGVERVPYDPDQAIRLLVEAGYTIPAEGGSIRASETGSLFSFELLYPEDAEHQALAEAIRQDWARLGVEVKLVSAGFDEVVQTLEGRLHQAVLVDLNLARSPDPDPYPFWHQAQVTGGQNYSKWDDRQASEYLEQARVTLDQAERTRLYRNFQVRFAQQLPALPLFYPVYRYAVDAGILGVSMGPLFDSSDRFASVTSWYLLTRRSSEPAVAIPEATATLGP